MLRSLSSVSKKKKNGYAKKKRGDETLSLPPQNQDVREVSPPILT